MVLDRIQRSQRIENCNRAIVTGLGSLIPGSPDPRLAECTAGPSLAPVPSLLRRSDRCGDRKDFHPAWRQRPERGTLPADTRAGDLN